MKQSSFRAICLIFMVCIAALSAFGDNDTPVFESRVLETFNNDGESPYEWRLTASKFAAETDEGQFPRSVYVPVGPTRFKSDPNEELKSLGIWGRFTRRGYNWIDIAPFEIGAGDDAESVPIPIPGRVQSIDMWVWGSNFRYDLEAYFRDYQGMIHVVKMGSINYAGWRNLRANIPSSVPQTKIHLPNLAELEFVKFRIWTQPTERVDNFYIYFNQFKILTDMYETPFDGDMLANRSRIQEFWNGGE